jgi:hypothetical protein
MRVMRPAVLLFLAVMAGACGSDSNDSPVAPTDTPNVAGAWTGTYHVKTCTDSPLVPAAALACPALLAATATLQPVTFTLTQKDTVLAGTITFGGWLSTTTVTGTGATAVTTTTGLTLPVTGLIDRGGTLLLQATNSATDAACPGVLMPTTLTNLNITLDLAKTGMTLGTFQLTTNRRASATGCALNTIAIQADQTTMALTR